MGATICIIDDDQVFCRICGEFLCSEGFTVISANSAEQGLQICQEQKVDIVLLDQKLPDGDGFTSCPALLETHERMKIIFITAYPDFHNALQAIKFGAMDYLSKPFELSELAHVIRRALRMQELEGVECVHDYQRNRELAEFKIIGLSSEFQKILSLADKASQTMAPVLLTGETGTGKNVIAKRIFFQSLRKETTFLPINCSALPEHLIESELFGFEKGTFTGAHTTRKGAFELADGGTIFLDEIAEIPLHLQTKLLQVLDDFSVRRLGGSHYKKVNVRVIAATNVDLEEAVRTKKFRKDLYYRLTVFRIHLPSLRERRADIGALCRHFIRSMTKMPHPQISQTEIDELSRYSWPGNVRELRNLIERAIIVSDGKSVNATALLPDGEDQPIRASSQVTQARTASLAEIERAHILMVFERLNGNISQTARSLDISLSTLKRRLREYGVLSTALSA